MWDDYTGLGVVIGVIDSGIEYSHPDLLGQIDTTLDHDAIDGDDDGSAETSSEKHGTTVAGTIAAAANSGIGVAGVAYGAKVAGFRQGFGEGVEAQLAENLGLQWTVDVSNISWGYDGFFGDDFAAPDFQAAGAAIENAVQTGRGGLGTVLVFSADNSGSDGQDVNYHSFQNSRYPIAVGATGQNGQQPSFSTPGAAVLISAPGKGIETTDRVGGLGYSSGDYVSITGTSFSSPIVAGVSALMIEANSDLGYRDVQEILAYSARQIDTGDPGWTSNAAGNWNGSGLHVSHGYGYGLVDAHAAVRLAETWQDSSTWSNEQVRGGTSTVQLAIPDEDLAGISDTISIASDLRIDQVEVYLDVTHTWIGDLTVRLTSPGGTESVLVNRPGVTGGDPFGTAQNDIHFTLSSTQFWDESAIGDWTLTVADELILETGTFDGWSLSVFGDSIGTDDLYVFTDEFATFTGAGDADRRLLSDGFGSDTINAAAVTSATILDLTPGGTSTLAGNVLDIDGGTTVENAFLGDGNDDATGNTANNQLDGGRGADTLRGEDGNDVLVGGPGTIRCSAAPITMSRSSPVLSPSTTSPGTSRS